MTFWYIIKKWVKEKSNYEKNSIYGVLNLPHRQLNIFTLYFIKERAYPLTSQKLIIYFSNFITFFQSSEF